MIEKAVAENQIESARKRKVDIPAVLSHFVRDPTNKGFAPPGFYEIVCSSIKPGNVGAALVEPSREMADAASDVEDPLPFGPFSDAARFKMFEPDRIQGERFWRIER